MSNKHKPIARYDVYAVGVPCKVLECPTDRFEFEGNVYQHENRTWDGTCYRADIQKWTPIGNDTLVQPVRMIRVNDIPPSPTEKG